MSAFPDRELIYFDHVFFYGQRLLYYILFTEMKLHLLSTNLASCFLVFLFMKCTYKLIKYQIDVKSLSLAYKYFTECPCLEKQEKRLIAGNLYKLRHFFSQKIL